MPVACMPVLDGLVDGGGDERDAARLAGSCRLCMWDAISVCVGRRVLKLLQRVSVEVHLLGTT